MSRPPLMALAVVSLIAGPDPGPLDAAELINPTTRRSISKGLAFLAARQNPDNGSFGSGKFTGSVAVTALSTMAYLSGGHVPERGRYGAAVDRAIGFILSRSQRSGLIVSDGRDAIDRAMYDHGFATLLLAEVHGMTRRPELLEVLNRAVRLIIETQNDDGGWRYRPTRDEADLSVTVCQLVALRAAHNAGISIPRETIVKGASYIRKCQMPDGGFRYQLSNDSVSLFPRSSAAIVGLNCCGIHDADNLRRARSFVASRRPMPPGPNGRSQYYFYGHYYAMQAMWRSDEDERSKWYESVRDELVSLADRESGAWAHPDVCPEYATAMSCLILQIPNNYLPIFER